MNTLISLFVVALSLYTGDRLAFAADEPGQKAILVTGASSGIGLRIAETLAENGFHVYAGARKAEDIERLDAMDNITAVRLDVTVQDDLDSAVRIIRDAGRGLWGIVNNAGVVALSPLATGPMEDIRFTFDVNVFGPIRVNHAFLPLVRESRGRTTIIGSINGFIAEGGDGGYTASKFAVEGYTDSLADELSESGIHVSIVDPGSYKSMIRAKMLDRLLLSADAGEIELGENRRAELIKNQFGNASLSEPDDVAKAVMHAMSSETPKRRYMVTPNAEQAALTIRSAMQRLLQLNEGQPYSYDRDELVAILDDLLAE